MKLEIREVVCVDGRQLVRITSQDERWYSRKVSIDGTTEQKRWDFVPSVTWICDYYPKGIGFSKWLASKGWDEAEAIRIAAGEKGDAVHQGAKRLIEGGKVLMSDSFRSNETGEPKTITAEEYYCLMTLAQWWEEERPEVLAIETTVWNEQYRYAGTLDLMCRLKSTKYKAVHLIDLKTSPNIWPSMELQVSSYGHADGLGFKNPLRPSRLKGDVRLGILQLGYMKNKKKHFKYTPVADQFDLFLAARKIWAKETEGVTPLQREYPLELSLASKKKSEAVAA